MRELQWGRWRLPQREWNREEGVSIVHELSLAYSVMEVVEMEFSRNGGGVLRSIEMEIGDFSGVDIEAFSFVLNAVWSHSLFADAELKLKRVEPQAECNRCGTIFCPDNLYAPCPRCGNFAFRLLAGEEFRLIALTVERKK